MNTTIDIFQVVALTIFTLLLAWKTIGFVLRERTLPFRSKFTSNDAFRLFDLIIPVGLSMWLEQILVYSFSLSGLKFVSPLHVQIVVWSALPILGMAVVALGLACILMGYVSIGSSWRFGIETDRPGALVTRGMFAISRHPIYLGVDLHFIGSFLINGTLFFALYALMGPIILHLQMLREERFLVQGFGSSYRTYAARTSRYITLLRRSS